MIEGNVELPCDSNGHHLLLLIHFVLQLYSFLLLIELPLSFIELGVVLNHIHILQCNSIQHLLLTAPNLCLPNFIHILQAQFISLVYVMLRVSPFDPLP